MRIGGAGSGHPRSRSRERSRDPLQPQLPYRNLDQILRQVSAGFFSHAYDNASWCFAIQTTLASITPATRLIRIHNVLNAPEVPDWVFEMIVFHEMLHLRIPPVRRRSGSWDAHPPAFCEAERAHSPNLDTGWAWLSAHVPLRRRPRLQRTDVEPERRRPRSGLLRPPTITVLADPCPMWHEPHTHSGQLTTAPANTRPERASNQ